MEASTRQFADATLLTVRGRVDHTTSRAFEAVLDEQLAEDADTGARTLVLDLGGLEYMTSAGLRVLMIAAKTCAARNRSLAVAALQPMIEEIFRISRFDLLLRIYPTVEDAFRELSPDAAAEWCS